MSRPQVTLLEMMGMILFAGVILGTVKFYDQIGVSDDTASIAVYLVVLCGATIGAKSARPGRRFWLGVAFYGWVYLAAGLQFGLSIGSPYLQRTRCFAALPMGVLCGIASWWFGGSGSPQKTGPKA